ncbi:hypothetical protein [Streptomyces anthocyanicus]|uniref:hypothetical protein n=1 Tax=Streptomyces anthocyanicus TaxID=68174 RepID=UPI00386949E2|nr:hypothetical protein OH747_27600 [Streptomyces anthocyanicus]
MTEHAFDLPPKASPAVLVERNALADEVCRELARSGLAAYRADLEEGGPRPGAAVHVDPGLDGGVFVDWRTEAKLRDAALMLFARGIDYANPPAVVLHHKNINDRMQVALLAILDSAGFRVEEPDGHAYGSAVYVAGRRP